jgi:hypothetical protein
VAGSDRAGTAADALSSCADRDGYYDLGIDLVVAGMRGCAPAERSPE